MVTPALNPVLSSCPMGGVIVCRPAELTGLFVVTHRTERALRGVT